MFNLNTWEPQLREDGDIAEEEFKKIVELFGECIDSETVPDTVKKDVAQAIADTVAVIDGSDRHWQYIPLDWDNKITNILDTHEW